RQTSLIRQRSSTVRRSRSKCSPVYREPRSWCTIAGREDFTITVLVRLIVLRYDKKIVTRGRAIYRLFTREMKELEKKLKAIQKEGFEYVSINQVLNWINQIRRDNRRKHEQP